MPKAPKSSTPNAHAAEPGRLPVTPDDVRAAAASIAGSVIVTECDRSRRWARSAAQPLAQIREPAVHLHLQGARRAESAAGAVAGRAAARRDRDVGRQSRARRGLSRRRLGIPATIVMPVGTPMAKIENTQASRRRDRHFRQDAGGGRRVRRAHGKTQNLTLVHPYDDPDHRGPGHGRARDARGRAGARHAGRSDRRRRTDLRHRGCGQGDQAGLRSSACRPSSIRRCTTPSRASPAVRGDTIAEGIAVKAPGRSPPNHPPSRR